MLSAYAKVGWQYKFLKPVVHKSPCSLRAVSKVNVLATQWSYSCLLYLMFYLNFWTSQIPDGWHLAIFTSVKKHPVQQDHICSDPSVWTYRKEEMLAQMSTFSLLTPWQHGFLPCRSIMAKPWHKVDWQRSFSRLHQSKYLIMDLVYHWLLQA